MFINGDERQFKKDITVSELLEELNINGDRVVIEVNFEIIPKENYIEFILNKEDKVEIVSFVGGG